MGQTGYGRSNRRQQALVVVGGGGGRTVDVALTWVVSCPPRQRARSRRGGDDGRWPGVGSGCTYVAAAVVMERSKRTARGGVRGRLMEHCRDPSRRAPCDNWGGCSDRVSLCVQEVESGGRLRRGMLGVGWWLVAERQPRALSTCLGAWPSPSC